MTATFRVICFTSLLLSFSLRAGAEDFTNAIQAFLQHRGDLQKTDGGIVIGIEDWNHAVLGAHPIDQLLPSLPFELMPQSETRFFERLSGMPLTFSRDNRGRATGLTVHDQGKAFIYEKISDEPPRPPEPPKRPVALKLAAKLLDACVGHYEQAPCAAFPAGVKVTIWREGDQLEWRASGKNAGMGAIEIYPQSESSFFDKLGGAFTFIKNDKGEATTVIFHAEGWPDITGKKLE